MDEILQQIISGEKSYYRSGKILMHIISRPEKYLAGEEILLIYNSYRISPRELVILLISHGCEGDYQKFAKLLKNQKK